MIIVTSWDDGYPADMKIADLLDHHGLKGTFFACINNKEGRPVLNKTDLRELDSRFEIGSHTFNHTRLSGIENGSAEKEIREGKKSLEDILGHNVDGFCYPGGHITPHAMNCLRKYGVRYARTIENFCMDTGENPYQIPTTLQLFPHNKQVYLRNYFKRGNFKNRWACFRHAMKSDSLWDALDLIVDECSKREGVLHLWGHSWEIEQYNLWKELDAFFSRVKELAPTAKNVGQSICLS